jgi:glycosyltransferase involved in cell wall biosynthesis
VDVGMCIDTSFYNNKHRIIAKNIFDIESSKKVIFVGADNLKDKRKGMHLFVESLTYMLSIVPKELHKDILIVIAGRNLNEIDENIIPVNIKKIDFIKDKRLLSLLYQASDLFVCPSIEDAGPMMTAEALSSGTPVVGFKTGLLYDDSLLTNGIQGYSVEMFDVKSLGCAIANILMLNDAEFKEMSLNARKLAINKLSKEVFVDRISKLC